MLKEFLENYHKRLDFLYENKSLNEQQFYHFKKRGIQLFDTNEDLNCYHLSKLFPYVVIGASNEYIDKMIIPYQSTSFLAGEVYAPNSGIYAYKIIGKKGGGVQLLTGGTRKLGDNIFASLHRILVGNRAIIVTINNMMENHDQIWSWEFFAKHLIDNNPLIYNDLLNLSKKFVDSSKFHFIVSIRSLESLTKSNFIDLYKNNKIAMLNPENDIKVIFITTIKIYNYLSKFVKESPLISYIITGESFEIQTGLEILRKKFDIKYLLNDGGRVMTSSIRKCGLLGEERVTLEPFNSLTLDYTIDSTCILGKKGSGLDNSEIEFSILLNSIPINDENTSVYLYPMDENKIF
ncbi:MAG: hypothetical protein H0X03_02770 [Nitrosopumilus sp.]|nr:hypothetical protein [Nitrosopumilus sp.]